MSNRRCGCSSRASSPPSACWPGRRSAPCVMPSSRAIAGMKRAVCGSPAAGAGCGTLAVAWRGRGRDGKVPDHASLRRRGTDLGRAGGQALAASAPACSRRSALALASALSLPARAADQLPLLRSVLWIQTPLCSVSAGSCCRTRCTAPGNSAFRSPRQSGPGRFEDASAVALVRPGADHEKDPHAAGLDAASPFAQAAWPSSCSGCTGWSRADSSCMMFCAN